MTDQPPPSHRLGWLIPAIAGVLQLATFITIGAVAVHYDENRMTPGPLMWVAVAGASFGWFGTAVRDYRRDREEHQERAAQRRQIEDVLRILPSAPLLERLSELSRERRVTGVVEAVALIADQQQALRRRDDQ